MMLTPARRTDVAASRIGQQVRISRKSYGWNCKCEVPLRNNGKFELSSLSLDGNRLFGFFQPFI
jgi:hypothetical protein